MPENPPDITQMLIAWNQGDQAALDRLMPVVYNELRRIARSYLRHERANHTLQATELVHEAYMRLIDQQRVTWQDRAHFFAIAAQMMRRILVNYAIAKKREKRNPGIEVALDDALEFIDRRELDLIALNDALQDLAEADERQCRIVELRFFGGLSIEETATVLGLSPATVKREWSIAKMWLYRQLSQTA